MKRLLGIVLPVLLCIGNFSFLIMSKTKATNFLTLIAFGVIGISLYTFLYIQFSRLSLRHGTTSTPNPTISVLELGVTCTATTGFPIEILFRGAFSENPSRYADQCTEVFVQRQQPRTGIQGGFRTSVLCG